MAFTNRDRLRRRLKAIPVEVREALKVQNAQNAADLVDTMKGFAPVQDGALVSSIKHQDVSASIQAAIVGAVTAANVASIAGMADGGLVTGRGGPRDDKELRRLSPGEFVVNARSTSQNRELLEQMNSGRRIPGLANGGMVGRVNAATSSVSSAVGREPGSSLTFAPQVDARGADLAAVARLERVLDEQSRSFADRVNGVREKRHKNRLGGRRS